MEGNEDINLEIWDEICKQSFATFESLGADSIATSDVFYSLELEEESEFEEDSDDYD